MPIFVPAVFEIVDLLVDPPTANAVGCAKQTRSKADDNDTRCPKAGGEAPDRGCPEEFVMRRVSPVSQFAVARWK
jgi:hypothetical protein